MKDRLAWLGSHADTAIAWASAGIVALGIYVVTWLQTYTVAGTVDQAYFAQAVWLIRHGKRPFVTTRGLHILADHSAFILYPIGWIFRWGDPAMWLMILQAVGMGIAAAYLYRIARGPAGLSTIAATALVAAFALHPGLHNLALSGFEAEALALPAGMAAAYYALERRWWPYAAALVVMLSTKEDYAVVAVGMGVWLFWARKDRRAGVLTAAGGLASFAFVVGWMMPHIARGEYTQAQRYSQYGETTGEVVTYILTHPLHVFFDLFTPVNMEFVTFLFVPVLFLAFLAPKHLIPFIPLQTLLLLSNQAVAHNYRHHYVVAALVWIFVACAHGFAKLRDDKPIALLLVAAAAFGFVQYARDSPKEHPWLWARQDAVDQARLAAYRQIPKDAGVAVSVSLLEQYSEREHIYGFPMPFRYYVHLDGDHQSVEARRRKIDYAVIDESAVWIADVDREDLLANWIGKWGFEKVSEDHGIIVLRRTDRPDNPDLPPLS